MNRKEHNIRRYLILTLLLLIFTSIILIEQKHQEDKDDIKKRIKTKCYDRFNNEIEGLVCYDIEGEDIYMSSILVLAFAALLVGGWLGLSWTYFGEDDDILERMYNE